MEKIVPMSWLNQVLLIVSIASASLCLVIQEWAGLTPLPLYASISWAIVIVIASVWLSCFLLRLTLKANNPVNIEFLNKWLYQKLSSCLELEERKEDECEKVDEEEKKILENSNSLQVPKTKRKLLNTKKSWEKPTIENSRQISMKRKRTAEVNDMVKEINLKCIEIWYNSISNDKSFPDEAEKLLKKLLTRLFRKVNSIDKVKLVHKVANVLLLHLKEYHRALRRVERGTAKTMEEAYKCLHPGSRSTPTLEHLLHRLVTVLAQEFLQWELTSSLPCKLLLSIIAKKLLTMIETISCPNWLFENLSDLLHSVPKEMTEVQTKSNESTASTKGVVSVALSDGITSATAAVIPRPLPKSLPDSSTPSPIENNHIPVTINVKRPSLRLENLSTEHRGLWGDSVSEIDSELDEDRISPEYEEPTDFATTIARLRNVLQEKSTVTTPLHMEEKSYVIYEGCQFTNLSIPWTEFHTAPDGSQQLLYCIQFDDVEQRGVDLFETTTATVRRKYSDFAQLHSSMEEIPTIAPIMSDLVLPEGGRIELETYLKTLCTRLANECPPQLRHFLRPNSSAGKKADAVAPRFDRFLAKTVSGVFSTLRTVVPGFEIEQEEETLPLPTLMPLADIPWRFVEDIKSKSLADKLQQLVAERTEYCTVDTAYEAVDSMEGSADSELLAHWREIVSAAYDEEIDELDSNLTLTCTAIDLICELLTGVGSNNTLQQEAVVRWTKLLFGSVTEPILQKTIFRIFDHLGNVTSRRDVESEVSEESIVQVKERLSRALLAKIPGEIKLIFGEDDTLKILRYLLSSYEMKKINVDLHLQILDVVASQLLISCKTKYDSVASQ